MIRCGRFSISSLTYLVNQDIASVEDHLNEHRLVCGARVLAVLDQSLPTLNLCRQWHEFNDGNTCTLDAESILIVC